MPGYSWELKDKSKCEGCPMSQERYWFGQYYYACEIGYNNPDNHSTVNERPQKCINELGE